MSFLICSSSINCDGWFWKKTAWPVLQSWFKSGSDVPCRSAAKKTFARNYWMEAWWQDFIQVERNIGSKVTVKYIIPFSIFDYIKKNKVPKMFILIYQTIEMARQQFRLYFNSRWHTRRYFNDIETLEQIMCWHVIWTIIQKTYYISSSCFRSIVLVI